MEQGQARIWGQVKDALGSGLDLGGAKQRLRITPGQNMVSQGSVQRSLGQTWQGFQIKKDVAR